MLYLFVCTRALTCTTTAAHILSLIHTVRLFSLIFPVHVACIHFELVLNRCKTLLSLNNKAVPNPSQSELYVFDYVSQFETTNLHPKPQKSWIVLWSILHIVLLIMQWFTSTKRERSDDSLTAMVVVAFNLTPCFRKKNQQLSTHNVTRAEHLSGSVRKMNKMYRPEHVRNKFFVRVDAFIGETWSEILGCRVVQRLYWKVI